MPLERRDVETSLQKKGFVVSSGDHSFFFHLLHPNWAEDLRLDQDLSW
jgi:hypothetical protein